MAAAATSQTNLLNPSYFATELLRVINPEGKAEEITAVAREMTAAMISSDKPKNPNLTVLVDSLNDIMTKITLLDPDVSKAIFSLLERRQRELELTSGNPDAKPSPEMTQETLIALTHLTFPICRAKGCTQFEAVPFTVQEGETMEEAIARLGHFNIESSLKKCARCHVAMYCGRKHQIADWHRHKTTECFESIPPEK